MVACSGEDRVMIRERSELGEKLGTDEASKLIKEGIDRVPNVIPYLISDFAAGWKQIEGALSGGHHHPVGR